MGDFNDISHHHEKLMGRRKNQHKLDGFNKLLSDLEVDDIGCKGQRFTWSNNRGGLERVMERLDRRVGNRNWCANFYKCQCINELAIESDHSPIIISLCHNDQNGRKHFRFEEMWLEKEQCYHVIKESWQEGGPLRHTSDLKPKFDVCKRSLIEWSRKEFKHNIVEIHKVKARIKHLGNHAMMQEVMDEERALKSKIHALWKREEIYWKQRSRVRWALWG